MQGRVSPYMSVQGHVRECESMHGGGGGQKQASPCKNVQGHPRVCESMQCHVMVCKDV